jgi:predicted acylesterase/phospholipase RssA
MTDSTAPPAEAPAAAEPADDDAPSREPLRDVIDAVAERRRDLCAVFEARSPACYARDVDQALRRRDQQVLADMPALLEREEGAPETGLAGLAGLALSGGGVRSATFNIGVLQRLEELKLLARFDFLSTVSGGGYAGCALAAYRTAAGSENAFPFKPADPTNGAAHRRERIELRHLRRFSSYLVARGWIDAVVAALNAIGGILANVLIVLPWLLVLGMLAFAQAKWQSNASWLAVAAVSLAVALIAAFVYALTRARASTAPKGWVARERQGRLFAGIALVAVLLAAWMVHVTIVRQLGDGGGRTTATLLTSVTGLIAAVSGMRLRVALPKPRGPVLVALLIVVAALLAWSALALIGIWIDRIAATHGIGAMLQSVVFAIVALTIAAWWLPVNCGSLHGFYRDRLSKAYLFKPPHDNRPPIEDFDDCQLSKLDHTGPYLLVNACLNVSDAPRRDEALGDDYPRPGRRGAFFLFSKHAVGNNTLGYIAAERFERDNRLHGSLATAMAISGAAFGPNRGYGTRPGTVFLLTLLNARTGAWMRFPAPTQVSSFWRRLLGGYAYLTLFREAVSRFDSRTGELMLTDGGHVDNLGIYRLLEQKCSLIVASDAEADPDYAFEGLAAAVRLAKIDLGITVDIDPAHLAAIAAGKRHFAVGRIVYGNGRTGTLIYMKSSLSDEALRDVSLLHYHRSIKAFPHESTTDQFFTEQQFEAYRSLGQFVCGRTFEGPGTA